MFSYVVLIGLLALSHSTFAFNFGYDNDEPVKFDVYPLDEECAKESGVAYEDFEVFRTPEDLPLFFDEIRVNYTLCLARKLDLILNDGGLDNDLTTDTIEHFGFFTYKQKNNILIKCSTLEYKHGDDTFPNWAACIMEQFLFYFVDDEANILEHYNKPYLAAPKEALRKTLNAFHGVMLRKLVPKSWVSDL